jgi:hypothetical protein
MTIAENSVVTVAPTGARASVVRLWNDGTSGKDFADVRLETGEVVTEVRLSDLTIADDDVPLVPEGEPGIAEIEDQIASARRQIASATDPLVIADLIGWVNALNWVRGRGPTQTLSEAQDRAAYAAIRAALVAHSGNVREASKVLAVSPSTLHRHIDAVGLRGWLTDEYERGARQPVRE